ncbi:MAG: hypothetical protein AB1505_21560 [Candidatus Latescibacterota bacterium]
MDYEVAMLVRVAEQLAAHAEWNLEEESPADRCTRFALLESFALHFRNLYPTSCTSGVTRGA